MCAHHRRLRVYGYPGAFSISSAFEIGISVSSLKFSRDCKIGHPKVELSFLASFLFFLDA